MRMLGAILAGGQSRRFGSDKALADLSGRPMIAWVAEALTRHVDDIVVCGHPGPLAGMTVVADVPFPGLGPLGGLGGALRHAGEKGYEAVMSVGCDTPSLDPRLMAMVRAAPAAAFVARSPIIGRWPARLASTLATYLADRSDRSMRGWASHIDALPIEADVVIPNLNTAEDLRRFAEGGYG